MATLRTNPKGVVIQYILTVPQTQVHAALHFADAWVLSRLYSKSLVHFIGDSHVLAYERGRFFITHWLGPATAYNLHSKTSTTDSNRKLFRVIRRINKKRDIVVLVFGEIDCRVHIYNQYMNRGGHISISELIDKTILKYALVLNQLKNMGISFFVLDVPPAPRLGNIETRIIINSEFNERLKRLCDQKGYRFLEAQSKAADVSGLIAEEFTLGSFHLNSKVATFLEKRLEIEAGSLSTR